METGAFTTERHRVTPLRGHIVIPQDPQGDTDLDKSFIEVRRVKALNPAWSTAGTDSRLQTSIQQREISQEPN